MSYRHSTRGNLKYRDPRLVCNGQKFCGNGSCSVTEIIDFVADLLKRKIAEFEIEATKGDDGSTKIQEKLVANLEKKLSDISSRELSLWESQIDPDKANRMPPHVFQALTDKLVKEREETESALEKARAAISTPIDYQKKIVTCQKALNALLDDKVSVAEKNHLLKACISRITYQRDIPERILGKGSGKKWTSPPLRLTVELNI